MSVDRLNNHLETIEGLLGQETPDPELETAPDRLNAHLELIEQLIAEGGGGGEHNVPVKSGEGTASALIGSLLTNEAQGDYAIAAGSNNSANFDHSIVLGEGNTAGKDNQVIVGKYNAQDSEAAFIVADGDNQTAHNIFTAGQDITGDYITVGAQELRDSHIQKLIDLPLEAGPIPNSIMLQNNTLNNAKGDQGVGGVALGTGGTVSGDRCVTEGENTSATNYNDHAEGDNTIASGGDSHAEGHQTKATGKESHAEGYKSEASGTRSHAEGRGTKAIGTQAHAEGRDTVASGDNAHAEGLNTVVSPNDADRPAQGSDWTNGAACHTEGYCTFATKHGSHAEGRHTAALGNAAHAEGRNTKAEGAYSHAEGEDTTASGMRSHAGGYTTIAQGQSSFAHGENITATNSFSVGFGYAIETQKDCQMVVGKHNAVNNKAMFIVADGTSAQKHNVFEAGKDDNQDYIFVGEQQLTSADIDIIKGLNSAKISKVSDAVENNFAVFSANGALKDSGSNAASFEPANSAIMKTNEAQVMTAALTLAADPSTNLEAATKQYVDNGLSTKVDSVSGKQLSTEDYTTAEKTKLDNLPLEKGTPNNSVVMPNCVATEINGVALGKYNTQYPLPVEAVVDEVYTADTSWYNGNYSEFRLKTPQEFIGFINLVNDGITFEGKVVYLDADIDLNPGWAATSSIGAVEGTNYVTFPSTPSNVFSNNQASSNFMGILNGQGHCLKGLYNVIEKTDGANFNCGGLFGQTADATIKNLMFVNNFVKLERTDTATGSENKIFGGLVGKASNTVFQNIYIDSEFWYKTDGPRAFGGITGSVGTGGIVVDNIILRGRFAQCKLNNAYASWISGSTPTGLIAGHGNDNPVTISDMLITTIVGVPATNMGQSQQTLIHWGNNSVVTTGVVKFTNQSSAPNPSWIFVQAINQYIPKTLALQLRYSPTAPLFQIGGGDSSSRKDLLFVGYGKIIGIADSNQAPCIGIGETVIVEENLKALLNLLG